VTVGLRVLVVDDNPHVRWRGRVYPVNATFHRFLAAFLDLPDRAVASIVHAVPLRELSDDAPPPRTLPVDPRIRTVGTAPFDGIAGFLRRAVLVTRTNAAALDREVQVADVVWIKVPASNALLVGALALKHRKPRFIWVAGTARDVAAARYRGAARLGAIVVGTVYDAIGRIVAIGGQRVVVGRRLTAGDGVVASLLHPSELRRPDARWPRDPRRLALVWAGRVAPGKGVETLIDAVANLDDTVTLAVLGDGPARGALEERARSRGVETRIRWLGYVADRATYLDRLAEADLFVFPSPAEGFPKVVLDAMAVGVPLVASRAGELRSLAERGLTEAIPPDDPYEIGHAILWLLGHPETVAGRRLAAFDFATAHTTDHEAHLVAELWRKRWPHLP
jgi:glycosyltransferase involved in cell wall biosynthesis